MHNTELRQDVIQRILQRRSRRHVHERLEAGRTALVVIDMQNAFLQPGLPSEVPVARAVVPNINRLATALRDAGGTVVWVYTSFGPDTLRDWSAFFGGVYSAEFSRRVVANLTPGAPGHGLWPGLDLQPGDWRAEKNRFSAFLPGACDLAPRLRRAGVDTVLIAGTLTNVCCESSARDALMQNFHVVMLADGNAALSDADHNASLNALAQTFADVMDCDEVRARLTPAARQVG